MSGPNGPEYPDQDRFRPGSQEPTHHVPEQSWGPGVPPSEQPTQVWGQAPQQPPQHQAYSQAPEPEAYGGYRPAAPYGAAPGYQQAPEYGEYAGAVAEQPRYPQGFGDPQLGAADPGQTPGQSGNPAATAPPPASSGSSFASRRVLLAGIAGAVVGVVAVVLILGFGWPGFFRSKTLSQGALNSGVSQVLTQSYGLSDVGTVNCPSGVKLEAGTTFRCDVVIGGAHQQVTATVTDGDGTYRVERPSGS